MVLEPGLAHMSRQHMPACTSSAITGSIDTASCLFSMPVGIRQHTSAYVSVRYIAITGSIDTASCPAC